MKAGKGTTEIELKIGLASAADYDRLLARLGEPLQIRRQENLFLEDDEDSLARIGAALRVRHEVVREGEDTRRQTVLTLKHGARKTRELFERREHECVIELAFSDVRHDPSRLLALDVEPIRALRSLRPDIQALKPLGGFANERRVWRIAFAGDAAELPAGFAAPWEVDRVEFPGGPVEHEVEVELDDASLAGAVSRALHERLREMNVRTVEQRASKYARFRRYVLGDAPPFHPAGPGDRE